MASKAAKKSFTMNASRLFRLRVTTPPTSSPPRYSFEATYNWRSVAEREGIDFGREPLRERASQRQGDAERLERTAPEQKLEALRLRVHLPSDGKKAHADAPWETAVRKAEERFICEN
eukprot:TRINITY_DN2969_c0_g1_i1.p2 TRINITY_DN2969_c0_g1~~TRINITY_DN2969_c0_g1_i1.p2  ORF type:complete len:118 (-),score=8.03 TRINITY_DN2969_c0_g1_i1:48-401(-)